MECNVYKVWSVDCKVWNVWNVWGVWSVWSVECGV